jgi:hypothetical protein
LGFEALSATAVSARGWAIKTCFTKPKRLLGAANCEACDDKEIVMAENFRKGDRADWHNTRITTEPEIVKRSTGDNSERVGSEDDRESPIEER